MSQLPQPPLDPVAASTDPAAHNDDADAGVDADGGSAQLPQLHEPQHERDQDEQDGRIQDQVPDEQGHQQDPDQQDYDQQLQDASIPSRPGRRQRLLARLSTALRPPFLRTGHQATAAAAASVSTVPLPSPLSSSKLRSIADFHIRPDEPHHAYAAGEHVHGAVLLVLLKPLRITHLVVALSGCVRISRTDADARRAATSSFSSSSSAAGGSEDRVRFQTPALATLFRDEQVLSGDGRLEPGRYEFGFHLRFPDRSLPTSITFERGSISYSIAAALTRPISIAAITTCDRIVRLEERLDIAAMLPPSPRTILLEPTSRRPSRTGHKKQQQQQQQPGASVDSSTCALTSASTSASTSAAVSIDDDRRPSQCSVDACADANAGPARPLACPASPRDHAHRLVTAVVETLRGGALPGESVSVRISVQHIKPVKSLNGIIVTLYREAKISPASGTAFPTPPSCRLATPLSGLPRPVAFKPTTFRKDLSQTLAPLIVDPTTLQANVTVSVKVPPNAFPTIRRVPGDMISFRYRLEVIADLAGRLTGCYFHPPSSSAISALATASGSPLSLRVSPDLRRIVAGPWDSTFFNTASISRQRGVVVVNLEIVVGTHNSAKRLPRPLVLAPQPVVLPSVSAAPITSTVALEPAPPAHAEATPPVGNLSSNLSEKDIVRLAERRLLPSQPVASSASGPANSPEPSLPPVDPLEPDVDKDERRRQHLLATTSAPPLLPILVSTHPSAPPPFPLPPPPSAPVLYEDGYGGSSVHITEPLPRYER